MSRILAIVREDLGRGFALAGIEVNTVADAGELRANLDGTLASGAFGIVIVEEELMKELPVETRTGYAQLTVPLIIEVPGVMQWRGEEALPFDDYVARLVRRAVGYQLNLKL